MTIYGSSLSPSGGRWRRSIELVGLDAAARPAHRHPVGRSAPAARPRPRDRRAAGAAVPRRADHRLRSGRPASGVGARAGPVLGWHDGAADHPLPRRGRAPRRPRRRARRRADGRRGHARGADRRRARRSCASTSRRARPPPTSPRVLPAGAPCRAGPGRVRDDDADVGRPRRHRLGDGTGHRDHRASRCTRPSLEDVFLQLAEGPTGRVRREALPVAAAPARPPRPLPGAAVPRTPIAVFFVILLPLIMLVLFNALFGDNTVDTGSGEWKTSQFYSAAWPRSRPSRRRSPASPTPSRSDATRAC